MICAATRNTKADNHIGNGIDQRHVARLMRLARSILLKKCALFDN